MSEASANSSRFSWLEVDPDPDTAAPAPVPTIAPVIVTPPAPAPPPAPVPDTRESLIVRYRELTAALGAAPTDADAQRIREEREDIVRRGQALGGAPIRAYDRERPTPAAPPTELVPTAPAEAPSQAVATQAPVTPTEPQPLLDPNRYIAGVPSEQTGAIIYWSQGSSLSDVTALRQALAPIITKADDLPDAPSDDVVFTRSCKELAARHIIVRKHPTGEGYYVADETTTEGKPDVQVGATFRLVKGSMGTITMADGSDATLDQNRLQTVRDAFARQRGLIAPNDVSQWLVKTIRRFGGTTLNGNGGFYFVPRTGVVEIKRIKAALEQHTTHRLSDIPTLRVRDGIDSVLLSMGEEANRWIAKIEDELAQEKIGARAKVTRIAEGEAVKSKIRSYEELLGQPLAGAVERVSATIEKIRKASSRISLVETN